MGILSRLHFSRHSLLPLALALYCIPAIHAAVISPREESGSRDVLHFARGLLPSVEDSVDAESLNSVSATASDATAYLRIASLSIALYDFLMTIPGEFRLYASQPSWRKMTRACGLFICVRYMSVAALVTSNYGFFSTGWGAKACSHYQLVAPILKVFAVLFSQIIVSVRTYAISRKEPWVLYLLGTLFVVCLVPEFLGNVWQRVPVQNASKNCASGNNGLKVAWLHYLAAMMFDAVTMGISTVYLIQQTSNLGLMNGLSRLMLKEGMIYFILLTGVNILNLVLFRQSNIAAQSSAASLGQAVTMIMSQHIILSLHDWRAISTGPHSSNHELGPVSYAGNTGTGGPNTLTGRLRNLGTRNGATASDNGAQNGLGFAASAVTFEDSPNSKRASKHQIVAKSPNATRSIVNNLNRSKRGSEEDYDDIQGPLEIRVQVQEEVKLDYDAVYGDQHGKRDHVSDKSSDADQKW